jgi:hypothetical protein
MSAASSSMASAIASTGARVNREIVMTSKGKAPAQRNEGERSRTAARAYNKAAAAFANSGRVGPQAQAAKRAAEGTEGASLRRAERAGKARGKGENPAEKGKQPAGAKP